MRLWAGIGASDGKMQAENSAEEQRQGQEEVADLLDGDYWPNVSDSLEQWIDFAVTRGVSRVTAQSMTKNDLIKALLRLDNTSSE